MFKLFYNYIFIFEKVIIGFKGSGGSRVQGVQVCMGMDFSVSSLVGHAFISCSNRKQLCALSRKLK